MCFVTTEDEILFPLIFFSSCMSLACRNAVDFGKFIPYLPTGTDSFIISSNFWVVSLGLQSKQSCLLQKVIILFVFFSCIYESSYFSFCDETRQRL